MERRLPNKNINKYKRPTGLWKIGSAALAVLSVASAYPAWFIMTRLHPVSAIAGVNSWIMWLFIPVPLASVIFALAKKKRGMRYMGNYAVGIIMAVLMVVYGASGFAAQKNGEVFSLDNSHVLAVEEETGVDLPDEYVDLLTTDSANEWFGCKTEMLLDADGTESMLARIKDDERWLSPMPAELTDILNIAGRNLSEETYSLVYVTETGLFNERPAEEGTYRCIQICFFPASDRLTVYEYSADLS